MSLTTPHLPLLWHSSMKVGCIWKRLKAGAFICLTLKSALSPLETTLPSPNADGATRSAITPILRPALSRKTPFASIFARAPTSAPNTPSTAPGRTKPPANVTVGSSASYAKANITPEPETAPYEEVSPHPLSPKLAQAPPQQEQRLSPPPIREPQTKPPLNERTGLSQSPPTG